MSRRPTKRIHIHMYEDDIDFLQTHFGGQDNVGFSKVIREIVSKAVRNMQEKIAQESSAKHLKDLPDDLPAQ
jgi:hypothetical protein